MHVCDLSLSCDGKQGRKKASEAKKNPLVLTSVLWILIRLQLTKPTAIVVYRLRCALLLL